MQAKKHVEPKKKSPNETIKKSATRINEKLPRETHVRAVTTTSHLVKNVTP